METAERYQVASDGLGIAQTRAKKASVLMHYGQASSRRVLDALGDLYDARNVASNALVEYAIATLDFYRDTEALQVRPDGMWEQGPDLPVSSHEDDGKCLDGSQVICAIMTYVDPDPGSVRPDETTNRFIEILAEGKGWIWVSEVMLGVVVVLSLLSGTLWAADVILNEYNAVDSARVSRRRRLLGG